MTYFANGQIKAITELLADKSLQIQKKTVDYRYDKLGRLTKSATIDPIVGNETVEYSYDKVGNRLSQKVNGKETKYTYNANDHVLTAGTSTYTYDANGNTLTKVESGKTIAYSYNAENKLIAVTKDGAKTQFRYNPNGLRIAKKSGANETRYLLDGMSGYGDVVAEYQNGTKSKTYTIGHRRISQTYNGKTHYFATDKQGSVKFLSDDKGLTDNYAYDSFGVLKKQTGTTDNAFRYTGEQFDDTLGMYNLRARYYAPEIGRFYGLDTYQGQISDPNSLHKYLYTGNDPINMIDPTGHMGIMNVSISINIGSSVRGMSMNAARGQFKSVLTQLAKSLGPRAIKRELKKCVKNQKSCKIKLPILVLGGMTPTLTEHVEDAMTGGGSSKYPARFYLHYKNRQGSRKYFEDTQKNIGCNLANKIAKQAKYGQPVSCDEYPMFKTREGGNGKGKYRVSYRYVTARDNSLAGGAYGGLVSGSRLKSGTKKDFLVLPINNANIPTFPLNVRR